MWSPRTMAKHENLLNIHPIFENDTNGNKNLLVLGWILLIPQRFRAIQDRGSRTLWMAWPGKHLTLLTWVVTWQKRKKIAGRGEGLGPRSSDFTVISVSDFTDFSDDFWWFLNGAYEISFVADPSKWAHTSFYSCPTSFLVFDCKLY